MFDESLINDVHLVYEAFSDSFMNAILDIIDEHEIRNYSQDSNKSDDAKAAAEYTGKLLTRLGFVQTVEENDRYMIWHYIFEKNNCSYSISCRSKCFKNDKEEVYYDFLCHHAAASILMKDKIYVEM